MSFGAQKTTFFYTPLKPSRVFCSDLCESSVWTSLWTLKACDIRVGPNMESAFCPASHTWQRSPQVWFSRGESFLFFFTLAGKLGLDTGPHNTSPHRGQSHQISAASLGGSGAHFLTLWGSWVSEITLERCCDGARAVVRQQLRSALAVSNRQDDTQVI